MKTSWGKLLLILLPIAAAGILLWPTYTANNLEKLEEEALKRAKSAATPADSLKIMNDFKAKYGEELQSAKKKKLQLGLDLRGGMYVTLEVDVIQLLRETAQKESVDEAFNQVIDKTYTDTQVSDENALDVFLKNFDAIARPKGKTLLSYFDVTDLKDASEAKIIENLKRNIDDAIKQAQHVIRQRIDQYGVAEPNIQLQGNRRILLELPGIQNQEAMRSLISGTARLEFKLLRNNQDIARAFLKIDNLLKNQSLQKQGKVNEVAAISKDSTTNASSTSSSTAGKNPANPYEGLSKDQASKAYLADHQFTTLFITYISSGNKGENSQQFDYTQDPPDFTYTFYIPKDSIPKLKEILARPDVKSLIPFDLEVAFGAKPLGGAKDKVNPTFEMYSLKKEAELKGEVLSDARKDVDHTTNGWVVGMSMNDDGAEKWARITGANIGKRIAIVLDGVVYSAPNVINKITGGNSQIQGMANAEEASNLEITLKSGALKAPVKIIEDRVVGASLGEDSIAAGFNASMFAFILVVLFMVVYYAKGGLIADIAVLINVLLILGIMAALGGTLSLPGIAGIILTIGMAVDANILVYERVREELAHGKNIRTSIDEGFRRAFNAILDSNVNSFATGLILFLFGTGFIKGFALTLMIGILTTLFTAILVSKAMILLTLPADAKTYSFGQGSKA